MGWDNMISAAAREGSLKLMACDAQLLAQICCSHLFCLCWCKNILTPTGTNTLKEAVFVCHELLTSRFAEPWGKSPGIPQFTGASWPQSNPQWLKRFAQLSAVKILWHASHGRINDSVMPNLGLINAVLHLEKVACQCRKINSLFAEGLFHPNHFSLAFLPAFFKQHFQSGSVYCAEPCLQQLHGKLLR